jgi:butyryl-CoA dehydrogenase
MAHHSADAEVRAQNQAVYEYLVPIIKGWSTELSQDVTRDGVQVHGGMGFIEETGAAQHYRDAKILTIYEGTTAIQANDLIGRKTVRDAGKVAKGLIAEVRATEAELAKRTAPISPHPQAAGAGRGRSGSGGGLRGGQHQVRHQGRVRGQRAVPEAGRHRAGRLADGARGADLAAEAERRRRRRQLLPGQDRTTRFFADHFLSQSSGIRTSIVRGQRRRAGAGHRPVLSAMRHRHRLRHTRQPAGCWRRWWAIRAARRGHGGQSWR